MLVKAVCAVPVCVKVGGSKGVVCVCVCVCRSVCVPVVCACEYKVVCMVYLSRIVLDPSSSRYACTYVRTPFDYLDGLTD